jgi:hypothetical protein
LPSFKKGQNINGAVLLEPTTVKSGSRHRRAWICRVHNETIKIISEHHLKSFKGRNTPIRAGVHRIFSSYRYRCQKRNIFFDLTIEQFYKLSQELCSYCGAVPANQERPNGYTYNGLDRKDNRKGYTPQNSVPCCARCNAIKSNILTFEEMKAAMKAILRVGGRRKTQRRFSF